MGEISLMILKGPYRLGASLVFWCWVFKLEASSHTSLLTLYCDGMTDFPFVAWLIASIAWRCFWCTRSRRCSAASLFNGGVFEGRSVVLNLRRIWLGDRSVVLFLLLLWTAVVIASQWVQSSGEVDVTKWRYCSTHWFFRSDIPSVWGGDGMQ